MKRRGPKRRVFPWTHDLTKQCIVRVWLNDTSDAPFHFSVIGADARTVRGNPNLLRDSVGIVANDVVCSPFGIVDV